MVIMYDKFCYFLYHHSFSNSKINKYIYKEIKKTFKCTQHFFLFDFHFNFQVLFNDINKKKIILDFYYKNMFAYHVVI